MVSKATFLLLILGSCIAPASARDGGLQLVLACVSADAKMEVYLPDSVWGRDIVRLVNSDRDEQLRHLTKALAKPVIGYYALDLREYKKGKPLEPVQLSMTSNGAYVIINQHTRGLPPTKVPVNGGVVDIDGRYAYQAKCAPLLDK